MRHWTELGVRKIWTDGIRFDEVYEAILTTAETILSMGGMKQALKLLREGQIVIVDDEFDQLSVREIPNSAPLSFGGTSATIGAVDD